MTRKEKVKVLVVDDSATVRQTLAGILDDDPEIEVVGVAGDPFIAARRLSETVPDVITLDVEMPRMDGITFLKKLMAQHPIPVIVCSSLVDAGSQTFQQAMEAGAVDVMLKPNLGVAEHFQESRIRICDAVKAAAKARLKGRAGRLQHHTYSIHPEKKLTADVMLPPPTGRAMARTTDCVICMGASTGGTETLREILQVLPVATPGIVIVQHMPERFTTSFAERLNTLCAMEVKEAADGDAVLRGRILIAPGNMHTMLERDGARYHVRVKEGPLVSRHRPSVDVLFRSAAHSAGPNALGIIMTGMGDDGARGLREMLDAGARTLAQDEASCVVFGMPKEAIKLGAAQQVIGLDSIPEQIVRYGR